MDADSNYQGQAKESKEYVPVSESITDLFPDDGYLQFKAIRIANRLKRKGDILAGEIIIECVTRWIKQVGVKKRRPSHAKHVN